MVELLGKLSGMFKGAGGGAGGSTADDFLEWYEVEHVNEGGKRLIACEEWHNWHPQGGPDGQAQ